ncbi:DKNYY domain-containing protein, partial [Salmonella enterica]|uniref:DKNYY domain-containing protein n=1 Tax=Salmonella enterica TaxID=28901 RepID=UPI003CEC1C5A
MNEDDLYDIKILENVDKNTFENIGESYSEDKNNVYFNDEKIEGIDPKTFKLIDNFFVKDKNN